MAAAATLPASPSARAADRTQQLLHAPLLPTLLRLATPNVIGLFAMTIQIGYDGFILGRLGHEALAGVALVLPLSMLMVQMSAGGIGGATTAAVARALGAGRAADAGQLARHALLVGVVMAALFMLALLGFGRTVYTAMGGRGGALDAALAYSNAMFGGALAIWAVNVLGGIVRGAGNMVLPSAAMLGATLAHLLLCPALVFGWGPIPGLGVAGAALSLLAVNGVSALLLAGALLRPGSAVPLRARGWRIERAAFAGILRVGLPASLSPVISNSSIAVATAVVGSYGTVALAGYGVAARLEYILVPIAFGFGTALTTLVATNMGAGQTARALRAAWLGGGLVAAITGARPVDGRLHGRSAGARAGRRVPAHRRRQLRAVRPGPGAVLRLAGGRPHAVAAGGQPGAAGRGGAGRLDLRGLAAGAGPCVLCGGGGQPGAVRGHPRRGDPLRGVDALSLSSSRTRASAAP